MIKTSAIKLIKPEPMMVTWDTGRRCNYDCTYCENTRHDNRSPLHTLEEYLKTLNFIKEWTSIYNQYKLVKTHTNINFTGGEPTINPAFWDLVKIINEDENFQLSLTTNGAWSYKNTDIISKTFKGVTVSYHSEAHQSLKDQAINNILALQDTGIWLQVNVMLHADNWAECVKVYDMLKSKGIKTNPRPIGDGNVVRSGWFIDKDGSQRRTSHVYSEEQQEWFWKQLGITNIADRPSEGTSLGRSCCGGRCLEGKVNNEWQPVKIVNTQFEDWSCAVDWFFLHVDQHTQLVYHHQTCQALHDKKRGALGNIDDKERLLAELQYRLDNNEYIICPNKRCGCGMCIPKSSDQDTFKELLQGFRKGSFT